MPVRALTPAASAALFVLCAGATTCSFPDIGYTGAGGTGAQTTSTTTSTGGSTGTGGTGAGTSDTGATGGTGASGGAGGSGGATGGTMTTTTTPCTTDEDGDGYVSWKCPGGDDCGDKDSNTNPGITEPSPAEIQGERKPGTQAFDKNCDGAVEPEIPILGCNFGDCSSTPKGFQVEIACGESAKLGHCKMVVIVGCQFTPEDPVKIVPQNCL